MRGSLGRRVRRPAWSRPASGRDRLARLGQALPQPPGRGRGRALFRRQPHVEWRGVPDRDQTPRLHPASFLAGLALWVPPMTGPAVEAVLGEFGACAVAAGISDDFVREVAGLIKPVTSVL